MRCIWTYVYLSETRLTCVAHNVLNSNCLFCIYIYIYYRYDYNSHGGCHLVQVAPIGVPWPFASPFDMRKMMKQINTTLYIKYNLTALRHYKDYFRCIHSYFIKKRGRGIPAPYATATAAACAAGGGQCGPMQFDAIQK